MKGVLYALFFKSFSFLVSHFPDKKMKVKKLVSSRIAQKEICIFQVYLMFRLFHVYQQAGRTDNLSWFFSEKIK